MKSKFCKVLHAMFLSVVLSACATTFGSKSQQVTFSTIPQGADVYIDGKLAGKTPLSLSLDLMQRKDSSDKVVVSKKKNHTSDWYGYKVSYKKDGFYDMDFIASPDSLRYHEKNTLLCALDLGFAFPTLGIPLAIDVSKRMCNGYESLYEYALSKK